MPGRRRRGGVERVATSIRMRAMSGSAGLITGGTSTSVRAVDVDQAEDADQVAQLLPRDVGAERALDGGGQARGS